MKTRLAVPGLALAWAALLAVPTRALAEARFTHMDVAVSTHDRGKAADARLEILIEPAGGGAPVAYLDVQGQELAPNTVVPQFVQAAGTGFTRDELGHEEVVVRVTQAGHSAWSFSMDMVLHFDDGSQALVSTGDLSLGGSRDRSVLPLSLATVATPGIIGGMEKFAFRLLSKGVPDSPQDAARAQARASRPATKDFTHMDVAIYTHGRGKPANARLEILVAPSPGAEPVAYLDVPAAEFAPDSTAQASVPSAGAGFTEKDLKHEQVFMRVTSPEYFRWSFSYDVILHFGDGTEALLSSGDRSVSSSGGLDGVPLALSTVAHPSLLGGVAKFTFRVMGGRKVAETEAPQAPAPAAAEATPPGSAAPAAAPAPSLARARAGTHAFTELALLVKSGDRGKAADTRVEISVVGDDGGPAAAYLEVADQAFAPNSSVREVVPATGPAFTLADLKHRKVLVRVAPGSRGSWSCSMDLFVRFGDGTEALWSTGKLVLNEVNSQVVIPLGDATVAKPGILGGMQKAGFGLLNAIGH